MHGRRRHHGFPRPQGGAQNFATLLICLVLLLLAQGFARPSYGDAALVLALLGPAGTLVHARLLGPELPAASHRGGSPTWRRSSSPSRSSSRSARRPDRGERPPNCW
ncbi:MrpF/PhaF family protein [Streptomyces sp. CB01580]|uniref:MrpF/PhaF family protein n=1 Tax=Streptomyces sp. CB01580 TaxID=1703933 RepID=UPI001F5BF74A|nr:MrpF/PhaF family protein [Streptomyces sp. CB01580]